jgi:hypothetical protein
MLPPCCRAGRRRRRRPWRRARSSSAETHTAASRRRLHSTKAAATHPRSTKHSLVFGSPRKTCAEEARVLGAHGVGAVALVLRGSGRDACSPLSLLGVQERWGGRGAKRSGGCGAAHCNGCLARQFLRVFFFLDHGAGFHVSVVADGGRNCSGSCGCVRSIPPNQNSPTCVVATPTTRTGRQPNLRAILLPQIPGPIVIISSACWPMVWQD